MGITCKWTNDSKYFLLEHIDAIHGSPSQIYNFALCHKCNSDWSLNVPWGENKGLSPAGRLTTCLVYLARPATGMSSRARERRWSKVQGGSKGEQIKMEQSLSWTQWRWRWSGLKSEVGHAGHTLHMRQGWWSSSRDKVKRDSNSNIKPKASKYTGVVLKY